MQKWYATQLHAAGDEHQHAVYLVSEVETVQRQQANAALSGMDAAKRISSGQLQQAHRLRAESSPEALESERQANAILTDRVAELEKSLSVAVELFQDQSGDPVNEPDAYAWLQQANELMVR